MEKLSKEQIISMMNEKLSSYINESYIEKFNGMKQLEAYRFGIDTLNKVRETYLVTAEEYGEFDINNILCYGFIVYSHVMGKLVDAYMSRFVNNIYKGEGLFDEFDISNCKWYDEEFYCDLPYAIKHDFMEYVYIPQLDFLTDCRTVFVCNVPHDEQPENLLDKLSELMLDCTYIHASYKEVMKK